MNNTHPSNLLDGSVLLEHVDKLQKEDSHKGYSFKLQTVSQDQLHTLINNKDALSQLPPREFEKLVAELLKSDGYQDIKLVPRHNAPGPDIVAYNNTPLGDRQKFIVEVKRWKGPVNIDVVRTMMYRIDQQFRASGGLIVITSKFTTDATKEAQFHEWRLNLKDGNDVREWIKRHAFEKIEYTVEHRNLKSSPEGKEILRILSYKKGLSLKVVENPPCQRCGGKVICGYIDLGGVDYYDNYFHVCSGCLEYSHVEQYEQSGNEGSASCSFCNRVWEGINVDSDAFLSRLVAGID